MKTSFTGFWRRNLAFFRLAILSNLEYRFNFFTDAILQPIITATVEILLWSAIFVGVQTNMLNGFSKESYLAYVLWTAFITRITTNWMYEHRMINEIVSGSLNSILVRPMNFFEYYLSQFLGYKSVTMIASFGIPFFVGLYFGFPFEALRFLGAIGLVLWYLVFALLMSFLVSIVAFQLNKVHSLTTAKNLALWFFTGELFPLDILPEPYRNFFMKLPFANAVYTPVAYITGRVDTHQLIQGYFSTAMGIFVLGTITTVLWNKNVKNYSGTGA